LNQSNLVFVFKDAEPSTTTEEKNFSIAGSYTNMAVGFARAGVKDEKVWQVLHGRLSAGKPKIVFFIPQSKKIHD
jgi:hypothetical protein